MSAEFDAGIFKRRREEFLSRMQDGVAIFPAAPTYVRNGDVSHDYRQHSDFYYLTGFSEPGSLALLIKGHGESPEATRSSASQSDDGNSFVMFVPKRDKMMEIWNGRRAGPEGAKARFGADEAYTIEEIDEKVPEYLRNVLRLYVRLGDDANFDERVTNWLNRVRRMKRQGYNAPTELHDPAEIVHGMRLIKNDDDLRYHRKACEISVEAFKRGMRATRPGMNEYEVQAEIEYYCRKMGSNRQGYPSIVAGGDNANILHYNENNMVLNDGDLLLVDAGCEYHMYSADITRTWPVNGKFTDAQAEVYNWVLQAQLAAIDKCREGNTFRDPHNEAVRVITEGLVAMGLLEGDPAEIIAKQEQWDEDVKNKKVDPKKDEGKKPRTYREFYMHNTGHWLGMDVHDVGDYKDGDAWVPLRAGCVLTVEPGIYIAADRDDVPDKYKGIGVRIEDDVLVTGDDPDVLTGACPKTVEDIESLMEEAKATA